MTAALLLAGAGKHFHRCSFAPKPRADCDEGGSETGRDESARFGDGRGVNIVLAAGRTGAWRTPAEVLIGGAIGGAPVRGTPRRRIQAEIKGA